MNAKAKLVLVFFCGAVMGALLIGGFGYYLYPTATAEVLTEEMDASIGRRSLDDADINCRTLMFLSSNQLNRVKSNLEMSAWMDLETAWSFNTAHKDVLNERLTKILKKFYPFLKTNIQSSTLDTLRLAERSSLTNFMKYADAIVSDSKSGAALAK